LKKREFEIEQLLLTLMLLSLPFVSVAETYRCVQAESYPGSFFTTTFLRTTIGFNSEIRFTNPGGASTRLVGSYKHRILSEGDTWLVLEETSKRRGIIDKINKETGVHISKAKDSDMSGTCVTI
jgi:hypothetical protein